MEDIIERDEFTEIYKNRLKDKIRREIFSKLTECLETEDDLLSSHGCFSFSLSSVEANDLTLSIAKDILMSYCKFKSYEIGVDISQGRQFDCIHVRISLDLSDVK